MEHRLMILGSLPEFDALVKCAHERGYYTVVCDSFPEGEARQYADRCYTADVRSIDEIAQICRKEKIDHIITSFSDLMFDCMVRIADRAGIDCYITADQLPLYRQKNEIKALCRKLGIRVPKNRILSGQVTQEEIADFSFPCILKPSDSYGSRGLRIIYSFEQLQQEMGWIRDFSISGQVILEEISKGQEMNCTAFVADGEVYVLAVADRKTTFVEKHRIPNPYALHYPGREWEKAYPLVKELLQKYVNATGQKWGPVSTQCFFDGEQLEVCEIAGRMFGLEHELFTLSTGLSAAELLLDLQYDRERYTRMLKAFDPASVRYVYGEYFFARTAAPIGDLSDLRALCSHPSAAASDLFFKEGDRVGVMGPKPVAQIDLAADTREEALALEKELHRKAHARTEDGEELLFRPLWWDDEQAPEEITNYTRERN